MKGEVGKGVKREEEEVAGREEDMEASVVQSSSNEEKDVVSDANTNGSESPMNFYAHVYASIHTDVHRY